MIGRRLSGDSGRAGLARLHLIRTPLSRNCLGRSSQLRLPELMLLRSGHELFHAFTDCRNRTEATSGWMDLTGSLG